MARASRFHIILCKSFLFLLMGGSFSYAAGGAGITGGGSGVICFASPKIAQKYDSQLKSGHITPELIRNIKKPILSLERFELDPSEQSRYMKDIGDRNALLRKAYNNIKLASPLFYFRLQQLSTQTGLMAWKKTFAIGRIEDAKPRRSIRPECRRLQIARRTSDGNHLHGEGPVSQFLSLRIEFNQVLFELMSPLDQAILILHEQLYILSQSLGHLTSNSIRPLVNLFFYEDPFANSNPVESYDAIFTLRHYLVKIFGDYPLFFKNEIVSTNRSTSAFQLRSHLFNSFLAVLTKGRLGRQECEREKEKKTAIVNPLKNRCDPRNINSDDFLSPLKPEEYFVFISYFALDRTIQELNSEFLANPLEGDEMDSYFLLALSRACFLIEERIVPEYPGVKEALQFCADPMSFIPKEINQN